MVLRLKTRESRSLPGLLNARSISHPGQIDPDGEESSLYEQARQREHGPRKRPFHLVVKNIAIAHRAIAELSKQTLA